MALKPCRECGAPVSTRAKACPKCGRKSPAPTSMLTWTVTGLLVFAIGYGLVSDPPLAPAPATPEQLAEAERQAAQRDRENRELLTVVEGAKRVRDAMKKPESFELQRAILLGGGVICYEYMARNSFNDRAQGFHVVMGPLMSDTPADWNKHCANKTGADYTHAGKLL